MAAIDTVLNEFAQQFAKLPNFLGPKFAQYDQEVQRIAAAFDQLNNLGGDLAKSGLANLKTALNKLENIKVPDDVKKIALAMEEAGEKAQKAASKLLDKEAKEEEAYQKKLQQSKAPGGFGNAGQAIGGGFTGAIGSSIAALLNPFQALASVVGPFVQALNPSLMQQMGQALRNLQATIGVALVPVVQVLTNLFRQLSVVLYPAMQALAPILGQLTNVLIATLVPALGMVADLFVALSPAIEFVTSLLSAFTDVQKVLMTVTRSVVQTLYQVIAGLFGGVDLKNIGKQLQDAMFAVVKNLVLFAAYLSKFLASLGVQNSFIDILRRNLAGLRGEGPHAVAAPQNVGTKGFEQIGKDLAIAAFAAQGGGQNPQRETNDFLKDLVKMLQDIKDGKQEAPGWITEALGHLATLAGIPGAIREIIKALDPRNNHGVKEQVRQWGEDTRDPAGAARRFAENLANPGAAWDHAKNNLGMFFS